MHKNANKGIHYAHAQKHNAACALAQTAPLPSDKAMASFEDSVGRLRFIPRCF